MSNDAMELLAEFADNGPYLSVIAKYGESNQIETCLFCGASQTVASDADPESTMLQEVSEHDAVCLWARAVELIG